jgi:hypothetical protein
MWHNAIMIGTRPMILSATGIAVLAVAACRQPEPQQRNTASELQSVPQNRAKTIPLPDPPFDREGLIIAALKAGSAAALGADDQRDQAQLKGKKFQVRMRFGCSSDGPGAKGGWTYDEKAGVLRVKLKPDFDPASDLAKALLAEGFESVAGFSFRQPWLLSAGCPAGGTPVTAEPQQRLAIVQLLTEEDSRVQRLQESYEVVKDLDPARVPQKGLDLVLEGRFELLADGRAIHCTTATSPPNCIITVTRKGRAFTPSASASATASGVTSTATVAFDNNSVRKRVAP